MRESQCPTCGGRRLLPDPPARTKDEKIAFSKAWDKRYEKGQNK